MSNTQTLYIDSSEEITAVIERLKGSHEPIVALVVPKGGALIQSIVNLKLIRRAAQDAAKDVILVTTDKIGRNLATQVGIPVAANEKEIASVASGTASSTEEQVNVIAGVRIHRYYNEETEPQEEPVMTDEAPKEAPVLVPKTLLQPEKSSALMKTEKAEVPMVSEPEISTVAVIEEKVDAPVEPVIEEVDPAIQPMAVETVAPISVPVSEPGTIKRTSIDLTSTTTPEVNEEKKMEKVPKKRNKFLPLIAFIALIVLAFAAVSFLFLPKVHVVLAVKTQPISQDVTLTAQTSVTTAAGALIPAEKVHSDTSDTVTFNATGTKDEGTTATGTATLYNYSTTSSITVPSGTTVTSSGKNFTTTSDVIVPGYTQSAGKPPVPGTKDAPITATTPGTDSNLNNVSANNITVSGATLTFNTVNTSGGTSKQVNVITDSDIANAKASLAKQLQTDLVKKITDQLAKRDVKTADGADNYSATAFTTTQPAGTVADNAQATITGSLDRTVVDTAVAENAAKGTVTSQVVANQNRVIDSSTISNVVYNSDGSMTVTDHVSGKTTPVFTTSGIPNQIKGKSLANATDLIKSLTPAETVTITVSPHWWPLKRIPTFSKFITVETVYE